MNGANGERASASPDGPRTLVIDFGGKGLKAPFLDSAGRMVTMPIRMPTPYPCQSTILSAPTMIVSRGQSTRPRPVAAAS